MTSPQQTLNTHRILREQLYDLAAKGAILALVCTFVLFGARCIAKGVNNAIIDSIRIEEVAKWN
ncbi:hypothetical protein ACFFUT_12445 [Pseudohalocynthiibacter aestuariivivens]|uniref:Uncharacterized protein n=1 Tax=Pseudohalocynthiibacter aestuariivivens TaxID=1591409 RepID=A0ABV5JGK8_9RHOB|nr:hypothetical protein [Pseudohalocynthiibacter aestuariivivens]MBS9718968.1 hypothetical protein [Pseudohalocynthiibacter aestuariivivens]